MAAPAPLSPQQATTSPIDNALTKPSADTPTPTYLTIKHSPSYQTAKSHLSAGDLDIVLTLVEAQIASTCEALGKDVKEDDLDMHEALCPLYYLYGTTLLYLVEESESMMNGQQGKPTPEQNEEQQNQLEEEQEEVSDPTEDLQIAWENLDIARTILSRIVENFDPTSVDSTTIGLKADSTVNFTEEEKRELLLDLALTHTRLGDVQRANGNTSAVEDYSRSLEIRRHVLGEFDKLVADCHYSLAQAYGEAPSKEKEREDGALGIVAALGNGGGPQSDGDGMTKEEIAECLVKSIDHYLACGVTFAGYLANMCGKDAQEVTKVEIDVVSAVAAGSSETGKESTHAKTLQVIRQRIAELEPVSDADLEEFNDKKELLDEIQETLDTAEGSEEALKAVHAMKENEIRKHSGKLGEEVTDESGATTTIGFGAASASATAASTTIGFGTDNSTIAAAPMMVVKKKKKQASNDDVTAAKRAKSE